MSDNRITANLPSRDFGATEAFYARLGFATRFRDRGWMIMERDGQIVEFFPHPDLDPKESWFSACIRTNDIELLHNLFSDVGLPTEPSEIPRVTEIFKHAGVPRMFAIVDVDGSLWRVIDQTDTA